MHSHIRRMSTQWGERGAEGPEEGGSVHGKGCYRKRIIQARLRCNQTRFFAHVCFDEDRYVPWRHHPMAYVGA